MNRFDCKKKKGIDIDIPLEHLSRADIWWSCLYQIIFVTLEYNLTKFSTFIVLLNFYAVFSRTLIFPVLERTTADVFINLLSSLSSKKKLSVLGCCPQHRTPAQSRAKVKC